MRRFSRNVKTKPKRGVLVKAVTSPPVKEALVGINRFYQYTKNRNESVKSVLMAAESSLSTVASITAPFASPFVDLLGGWEDDGQKGSQVEKPLGAADPVAEVSNEDRVKTTPQDTNSLQTTEGKTLDQVDPAHSSSPYHLQCENKPETSLRDHGVQPKDELLNVMELVQLGRKRALVIHKEVRDRPKMLVAWVTSLATLAAIFSLRLGHRLLASFKKVFKVSGKSELNEQRISKNISEAWKTLGVLGVVLTVKAKKWMENLSLEVKDALRHMESSSEELNTPSNLSCAQRMT